MFERVEQMLQDARQLLLNDVVVRKLLYHDSNNALNMADVDQSAVEKYITNYPIYQFENKADYTQNAMVNVFLADTGLDDEQITLQGVLRINIVVNVDKWELVGGRCRPLALADRIIMLLNNENLGLSNPITIDSFQELLVSKKLVGYALLFNIADGVTEINLL